MRYVPIGTLFIKSCDLRQVTPHPNPWNLSLLIYKTRKTSPFSSQIYVNLSKITLETIQYLIQMEEDVIHYTLLVTTEETNQDSDKGGSLTKFTWKNISQQGYRG